MLIVKGPDNVDSTLVSRFDVFKNDQRQMPGIIRTGRSGDVPGGVVKPTTIDRALSVYYFLALYYGGLHRMLSPPTCRRKSRDTSWRN